MRNDVLQRQLIGETKQVNRSRGEGAGKRCVLWNTLHTAVFDALESNALRYRFQYSTHMFIVNIPIS